MERGLLTTEGRPRESERGDGKDEREVSPFPCPLSNFSRSSFRVNPPRASHAPCQERRQAMSQMFRRVWHRSYVSPLATAFHLYFCRLLWCCECPEITVWLRFTTPIAYQSALLMCFLQRF